MRRPDRGRPRAEDDHRPLARQIAERVGFSTYRTFLDNYKDLRKKKPPSEGRRRSPPPLIDDETGLLAVRGLLDEEGLVHLMQDLLKIYSPNARRVREEIGAAAPEPVIIGEQRPGVRERVVSVTGLGGTPTREI